MVLPKFFLAGLLVVSQGAISPVPELSVNFKALQSRTSCLATTFSNITGFILTEY